MQKNSVNIIFLTVFRLTSFSLFIKIPPSRQIIRLSIKVAIRTGISEIQEWKLLQPQAIVFAIVTGSVVPTSLDVFIQREIHAFMWQNPYCHVKLNICFMQRRNMTPKWSATKLLPSIKTIIVYIRIRIKLANFLIFLLFQHKNATCDPVEGCISSI